MKKITNIINPSYFTDPASPFMRAIIDLHDYVFMFLIAVLVFVFYIMYMMLRNNNLMIIKPKGKRVNPYKRYTVRYFFNRIYFISWVHFFFFVFLAHYWDIFMSQRHQYYIEAYEYKKTNFTPYFYSPRYLVFARIFGFLKNKSAIVAAYPSYSKFFFNYDLDILTKLVFFACYLIMFIPNFIWKYCFRFGSSATQFAIYFMFRGACIEVHKILDAKTLFYGSNFLYKAQLRKSALIAYKFTHHDTLETVWTVIPSIILVFIAIPSLLVLFALDEIGVPLLTIKAVGHQWYWSYEVSLMAKLQNSNIKSALSFQHSSVNFDSYMVPTSELKMGQHRNLQVDNWIVIPSNYPIRIIVTSMDVLHSWTVPAFGIKVDAVPGRLNQLGLFADRPGTFYGQCSEICGTNHGFMPIMIEVWPAGKYEKDGLVNWLALWFLPRSVFTSLEAVAEDVAEVFVKPAVRGPLDEEEIRRFNDYFTFKNRFYTDLFIVQYGTRFNKKS